MHVKSLVLAAAATALFAAGASAQTPKRGGILIHAIEGEVPKLDCHQEVSIYVAALARPMYSTLVRFDQNNFPNILPDLAESWTVAPDGLTYTFKIRGGVKFHDGSILTSEDIRASLERIRNPPPGIVAQRKADYDTVSSIEAPDPATVVIRMRERNAAMMELLAYPLGCIYSARKLQENQKYPETTPMGTGPFVFQEWVQGSHRDAKRFDGYFRPGLPYLDGTRVAVMSPNAVATALEGGQIDAFFRSMTPQEEETLAAKLGDKLTRVVVPQGTGNFVTINNQRKPFDDVRVRRALSLALARWDNLAGIQKIARQYTSGGLLRPGYDLALPQEELEKIPGWWRDAEKSRAEARRLLAEAGVPNLKINVLNRNSGTFVPIGLLAIDQWMKVGLQPVHEALPAQVVIDRQNKGDFDVTIEGYGGATDDPNGTLTKFLPGVANNLGKFEDPMLLELFNKQKGEPDRNVRRELNHQFERRVLENAYILPLYYGGWMPGMRSTVKNWKPTSTYVMGYDMTEVWVDK